jgi:hypothetical protein
MNKEIITKNDFEHTNIIAWINNNGMMTENEMPFDFDQRRCMIQPYTDMSKEQWWTKCAQIGGTDALIMKAAYYPIHYGMNVIYVLPTRSVVKDFVKPKVNKLYQNNPEIARHIMADTENIKQLGNRFVYFRGAFSETDAIGIQADLVIGDEYDRSNQQVLKTYRSRLDSSQYAYYWMFSNPSIPGFGVDEGYQASDQMHWFVTCPHCGHEWYMDYEKSGDGSHYVFVISRERGNEQGFYACGKCDKEIPDESRKNGRWVAKYPKRFIRGYWFNQCFMPWIPASKIIADDTDDQAYFHNFTLGKAYVNADSKVTREMVIRNYQRGEGLATGGRYLGIDTGKDMHWMLGDDEGAIDWGSTRDWDEIERIIVSNQALTVFDPNPNPRKPLELVKKYPHLVHLNYYVENSTTSEISLWAKDRGAKGNTINTDRTRAFDRHLYNLGNGNFKYKHTNQSKLDEVIEHWGNLNRIIEERVNGGKRAVWRRPMGKADHLAHANIYMEIAREEGKGLGGTGIVRSAGNNYMNTIAKPQNRILIPGQEEGTILTHIDPLEIARKNKRKGKRWG